MNPVLYATSRSLVQGAVSWLLAHFIVIGALLSSFGVDSTTAVDWTMSAVVLAGYVWLANWLGSRTGIGTWSKLARLAAKVLMLGLAKTPSYGTATPAAR